MTQPYITSFFKPVNEPGRLKRKRPRDNQHGTTAATDQRTKTLHPKNFNMPIKDPSRHTSGRVRNQRKLKLCTFPHDDRAHDAFKVKILEEDIQREAEVDRWLEHVIPLLEAGEQIQIGRLGNTRWHVACREYWEQYIGPDHCWDNPEDGRCILFGKKAPGVRTTKQQIVVDQFWMKYSASPGCVTSYPFTRPEYASLEPVIVSLRYTGSDMKIWFLSNGCARIEWNTTFLTGKERGLLKAGGLMMSCIEEEEYTNEYDSGSDATEEESDSEEEDEESSSEEEWSDEGDGEESDSEHSGIYGECDNSCEKCTLYWSRRSGVAEDDESPKPPGMTQARIDYEFRRLMNRREPAP